MTQLTMITRHGVTKDKVDAYTLISADNIPETVINTLENSDDVIRVRKI